MSIFLRLTMLISITQIGMCATTPNGTEIPDMPTKLEIVKENSHNPVDINSPKSQTNKTGSTAASLNIYKDNEEYSFEKDFTEKLQNVVGCKQMTKREQIYEKYKIDAQKDKLVEGGFGKILIGNDEGQKPQSGATGDFVLKEVITNEDIVKESVVEMQVMKKLQDKSFGLHPYRYITLRQNADQCLYTYGEEDFPLTADKIDENTTKKTQRGDAFVVYTRMDRFKTDLLTMNHESISHENPETTLFPIDIVFISHAVMDAGMSLIGKSLVHQDIKCANIFMNGKKEVHLADLSKTLDYFKRYKLEPTTVVIPTRKDLVPGYFKGAVMFDIAALSSVVLTMWTGLIISTERLRKYPSFTVDIIEAYCGDGIDQEYFGQKILSQIDGNEIELKEIPEDETHLIESYDIFTPAKQIVHKFIFCKIYQKPLLDLFIFDDESENAGNHMSMYKQAMDKFKEASKMAIDTYILIQQLVDKEVKVQLQLLQNKHQSIDKGVFDKLSKILNDVANYPTLDEFMKDTTTYVTKLTGDIGINFVADNAYLWSLDPDKIKDFVKNHIEELKVDASPIGIQNKRLREEIELELTNARKSTEISDLVGFAKEFADAISIDALTKARIII